MRSPLTTQFSISIRPLLTSSTLRSDSFCNDNGCSSAAFLSKGSSGSENEITRARKKLFPTTSASSSVDAAAVTTSVFLQVSFPPFVSSKTDKFLTPAPSFLERIRTSRSLSVRWPPSMKNAVFSDSNKGSRVGVMHKTGRFPATPRIVIFTSLSRRVGEISNSEFSEISITPPPDRCANAAAIVPNSSGCDGCETT